MQEILKLEAKETNQRYNNPIEVIPTQNCARKRNMIFYKVNFFFPELPRSFFTPSSKMSQLPFIFCTSPRLHQD